MIDSVAPTLVGLWAAAYLVGAAPVSYLLARFIGGVDLRSRGSGNVGGSNLASQLGRRWFPVVIVIDLTRGAAPVLVGQYILGLGDYGWLLAATPLFTVIGNAWSPFLRFTGGRSVGVWAGGLLGISPSLLLAGLAAYVGAWIATRRSAESLLAIMALLPFVCLVWSDAWVLAGSPQQLAAYAAAGAVLILAKRLVSNGGPLPDGVPFRLVMMNRLLRDRDIADRRRWLSRVRDQSGDF